MRYTALGGAYEVGASCHLLQIAGKNIVLDAGLRPNRRGTESLPDLDLLEQLTGGQVDLVLVSHAHMDHIGALPLLHAQYPLAPIYASRATRRLMEVLLADTLRIMERRMEDAAEFPLYSPQEVEALLANVREMPFDTWTEPIPEVKVYYHRSGHVLGAAAILIETPEAKVVYSGDISVASQRTVAGMRPIDFFQPDLLILEGTYGDQIHPNRKEQEQELARSVGEVVAEGGTVLIPSFALGRAQEIILILKTSMNSGLIPQFPIYVDGMVRTVCDVYHDLLDELPDRLQKYVENSHQPLFWSYGNNAPKVIRLRAEDRITMLIGEPKCIISSSGMLVGGPSVYYAKVLASMPKNAIFFTGYQDEESPGRRLLELSTGDTIELDGEKVPLLCRIGQYKLSAHADQIQLCQQVSYIRPKSIILVHGEGPALQALRSKLVQKHLVFCPRNGDTFDPLAAPEWMTQAQAANVLERITTYRGDLTTDSEGVQIRLEPKLLESPLWQQYFLGYERVEAKLERGRLVLRPVAETERSASEE
ncbi:MAG: hypothetical protein KatS3mg115_2134 [Candidatus Poribacteria bacterium]|nr:MAG: hypothetical protein KatS3mg115_2134 [Candidatus Poribacteria bacterium]